MGRTLGGGAAFLGQLISLIWGHHAVLPTAVQHAPTGHEQTRPGTAPSLTSYVAGAIRSRFH